MNVRQLQRENSTSTSGVQKSPKPTHKHIHNKNLDGVRGSVSPVKQRPAPSGGSDGLISPKNVIVEKLHSAINAGNIEEVRHIIDEGLIKVNARDSSQNTPLHTAIIVGNLEFFDIAYIANYLVQEGVNPSLVNEEGNTPLHLSCVHQDTSFLDLVISATNKTNPLTTSVSAPSLPSRQLLIRHQTLHVNTASTSPPSTYGGLSFGSMNSMAAIIPPLATFLNKGNARGNTALHIACFHGNVEAVRISFMKYSRDGAEISTNGECWTPLHHAASMGHHIILASLLTRFTSSVNSRDALGRTPLLLAAAGGHFDAVKLFAKSGADATLEAENGDTAVHLAIRHLATLQAPCPDLALLEVLLTLNPHINATTKHGNSPLHIACLYGASSIVDLLLKQNLSPAEINRLNSKLHSPLFLAVMRPAYHHFTPYQGSREKERLQIIKALLSAGAQIYKRKKPTGKGKCILHAAAKNGFSEIIHYLTTTVAPSPPVRRNDGPTSPVPPRTNSPTLPGWKNGETHAKIEDALRNIDPAVRDNMGRTPLHYAVMAGSELCVNVFMRTLGAKLSLPLTQDIEGSTPLHLAALYGHSLICEILIRETEVPDLIHMTDTLGNTPLHNAALGKSSDTVNALLMRGALVSQTNLNPIHMACMPLPPRKLVSYYVKSSWVADSLRMCTSLLEYGAEDELGWTPLDYALATAQAHLPPHVNSPVAEHNFVSISANASSPSASQVSIASSPPQNTPSVGSPKLITHNYHATHIATEEEPAVCVAQFLALRGASTHTRDARMDHALHRAVAGGCVDCVRALLEKGEDVEALGAKERSPLHIACALGHATLTDILLEHGANVNSRTSAQLTPLHLAARNGSLMSAELLIARGAVVDSCCSRDWTPLHHACAMGHTEVASLLIDRKADVNSIDITGRTPLHKATYYSHPECVMVLVERGAKPNAEDENGETPVHYASIRGLSAALIFMSAVGADHGKPTKKGSTPIHLAARYDHVDTAMFLIEKDAEVLAAVTRKGRSPLHVASRYGKENVTHVLLEHGADCNATDVYGNTPLHMAAKYL